MFSSGGSPIVTNLDLMILPLNTDTGGDGGAAGNDYQNHIEPFTPMCNGWKAKSVSARMAGNDVEIKIDGSYAEAVGGYMLTLQPGGRLAVAYDFTFTAPKKISPRQWGVVLTVPPRFDRLQWRRDAQWTVYPEDHIGRPVGNARADAVMRDTVEQPGVCLTNPWMLDASNMGTNDFRSTKYHIRQVGLSDATGAGLQVESDGSDSSRAWVEGTVIHLLIAGYHTGGSDGFFAGHFAPERRPLPPGTGKVTGSFVVTLADAKSR